MPSRFITTEKLGSGWAAMQYWVNTTEPDLGPFWEVYDTGIGRYQTEERAEIEAKQWSKNRGIPFTPKENKRVYMIAHQDDA